jgi:hypothetical protein
MCCACAILLINYRLSNLDVFQLGQPSQAEPQDARAVQLQLLRKFINQAQLRRSYCNMYAFQDHVGIVWLHQDTRKYPSVAY